MDGKEEEVLICEHQKNLFKEVGKHLLLKNMKISAQIKWYWQNRKLIHSLHTSRNAEISKTSGKNLFARARLYPHVIWILQNWKSTYISSLRMIRI